MKEEMYKGCPVQFAMQFLAGKWQIAILWRLRERPMRFRDLKQSLQGITDKVLAAELLFFEQKGVITRSPSGAAAPRPEYCLTGAGKSLLPLIQQIVTWGYEHLQDEKMNRSMYTTPADVIAALSGKE